MKRILMAGAFALMFASPLAAQDLKFVWTDHPGVRAGKWLRIDFRARVQNDMRRSEMLKDEGPDTGDDVARRRVGVEGRLGQLVDFEAEYELGSHEWRDVSVNYRQFKVFQVRAGRFKMPFSLDENTGATNLDFIYRSRISSRLAPGRDRGVSAHGSVFKGAIAYEAGVFRHDGDNARSTKGTRVFGGRTTAARILFVPFRASKSALAELQAGMAISGTTVAEGFPSIRARTVLGASFFDSDIWVNGRRQRTGFEMRWRPGPYSVQAEYIRLSDQRRGEGVDDGDLSPLVAQGWYVSGTYALTGERKARGLNTPRHRFGAVELAARIEALTFGDTSAQRDSSVSWRPEIVAGNADHAITAGVNWYLTRWVKIQANVIRERIHDPSMGPLPNQTGFWSRLFRVQFAI